MLLRNPWQVAGRSEHVALYGVPRLAEVEGPTHDVSRELVRSDVQAACFAHELKRWDIAHREVRMDTIALGEGIHEMEGRAGRPAKPAHLIDPAVAGHD